MYVNPFLAGIVTTIIVEGIALIAYAIYLANVEEHEERKGEDNGKYGN